MSKAKAHMDQSAHLTSIRDLAKMFQMSYDTYRLCGVDLPSQSLDAISQSCSTHKQVPR